MSTVELIYHDGTPESVLVDAVEQTDDGLCLHLPGGEQRTLPLDAVCSWTADGVTTEITPAKPDVAALVQRATTNPAMRELLTEFARQLGVASDA